MSTNPSAKEVAAELWPGRMAPPPPPPVEPVPSSAANAGRAGTTSDCSNEYASAPRHSETSTGTGRGWMPGSRTRGEAIRSRGSM